jgi:hypothetical protein
MKNILKNNRDYTPKQALQLMNWLCYLSIRDPLIFLRKKS